jgi:hypothetical protein
MTMFRLIGDLQFSQPLPEKSREVIVSVLILCLSKDLAHRYNSQSVAHVDPGNCRANIRRQYPSEILNVDIALGLAGVLNAAMVIMAAAHTFDPLFFL